MIGAARRPAPLQLTILRVERPQKSALRDRVSASGNAWGLMAGIPLNEVDDERFSAQVVLKVM
ncbi:hypothetical protein ACVWWN_006816 [Mycobacterium sp. URHB0021]|jgi:hypothetical protein